MLRMCELIIIIWVFNLKYNPLWQISNPSLFNSFDQEIIFKTVNKQCDTKRLHESHKVFLSVGQSVNVIIEFWHTSKLFETVHLV